MFFGLVFHDLGMAWVFTWIRFCFIWTEISFYTILLYPLVSAVVWRCSVKKVFFQISQNSQENTCARVSFLMLQACESVISIKLQSNFRVRHRISLLILRDFKIINFYSPWNHNNTYSTWICWLLEAKFGDNPLVCTVC